MIPFRTVSRIVTQGIQNLANHRPLAISLEVTHSCNCNCKHCNWGGVIRNEPLAPPEYFAALVKKLKPLVAQISGGEPLLRKDIFDLVQGIRTTNAVPYLVFVTNARLLTVEKYQKLKEAGIDEFSISLDFPDERHDRNRGVPGLFRHLSKLIPRLTAFGRDDITMISVIRKDTLPELEKLARKALGWGAKINFSAYTPLRTRDFRKMISSKADLLLLKQQIEKLIQLKRETGRIFTSESVFWQYYRFFASGGNLPGCRAGFRSLVVNPNGKLAPCAMQAVEFTTQRELVQNFSRTNNCGGCYVSLRANTEKRLSTLIRDAWWNFWQL